VRRNLAAARSGASGIGVLAASGPGTARLIAQFVIRSAARSGGSRSALLCRGLAAARLRCVPELGIAIHLRARAGLVPAIHLLRPGAAGLIFAISGGAAARFSVVCHRISPGKADAALRARTQTSAQPIGMLLTRGAVVLRSIPDRGVFSPSSDVGSQGVLPRRAGCRSDRKNSSGPRVLSTSSAVSHARRNCLTP
jgi:hypothetical protein